MQHFYDAQIRRYILQFIRMMSNFSYVTGKNSKGESETLQVPVKYGDMSRQVAQIIKKGSENTLIPAPQISCYITNMAYDRDRMYNPYYVDKKHIREREFDPVENAYTGAPGQSHTIERIMPTPFELTFNADIFSTNTDQKLQILEQILVLFNPALELQTTDNFMDWTSLSFVELTNVNFTSRAIPQGIADEIDVATLTFRTPIFISPPAKLKKLGVIEKIVMSIYDEDAGTVDVDGILGESLLSRQNVTPGQFAVLLLGNRITLLGETNKNNSTHASNRANKVFTSQSQFGDKINWHKLEGLYSKTIQNGISNIKLQQSATNVNGDDIIVNVTGTVSIDPQDEFTLLLDLDTDSVPTNTLDAVDAVVNPLTFNPSSATTGTRYLITEDIGNKINSDGKTAAETDIRASDSNPPPDSSSRREQDVGADEAPSTTPSAWGNTIASANDIIQKNADGYWDRVFDADANTDLSDSSFTAVQYVTNLTTGVQFKWLPDSGFWVKSYEGFYEPGTWSIEF